MQIANPAAPQAPTSGPERDPAQLRSDLRAMLGDGVAFSVMVGCGESYLPAFALALGLGDVVAGLIATIPMLAGSLIQLATPPAVARLRSHRRWVVLCAGLQAASFLPLIWGALSGWLPRTWLFVVASLYWGFGMATSPAWNTWAGTLVPPRIRPHYFALRARWSHLALLAGLGGTAWLLDLGVERGEPVRTFAIVFALALGARAVSTAFLARQSEARPVPIGDLSFSATELARDLREGGHLRLLGFLLCFQLAVWTVAPFFTPYMLGALSLSYAEFTLLTGAAFVSRVLLLPTIGRWIQRVGTRRVLWIGSLGIVPLPGLWVVSDHLAWLLLLQLFAGAAWGTFELTTLLSFFEQIPERRRTALLSLYNLANAAAIVAGGAIGAALLDGLGRDLAAYTAILLGSTALRVLALPLLRHAHAARPPAEIPTLRTLSVRPSSGGVQRPILPTLPAETGEAAPDAP